MKRISTVLPNKFFMKKLLKKYMAWPMNAVKNAKTPLMPVFLL